MDKETGESEKKYTIRLMGVELPMRPKEEPHSTLSCEPRADNNGGPSTTAEALLDESAPAAAEAEPRISIFAQTACSDSDENRVDRRGGRFKLSRDQIAKMKDEFKRSHRLCAAVKTKLSTELGLKPRQVEIWFQNRRARLKSKHLRHGSARQRYDIDERGDINRSSISEIQQLEDVQKWQSEKHE